MKKSVNEIVSGSKEMIKTLILSCHGMLECGIDYKGTMTQICRSCEVTDDENHRLNECINFSETNRANDPLKSNFEHVYSINDNTLKAIMNVIQNVWELRYTNSRMKKPI